MFCPSCGTELMQEMSYCNRCGANLKPPSNQTAISSTKSVGATGAISIALIAITLGGFGLLFGVIMALISRGFNISEGGQFLIFAALMVILIVDCLLIRQLSRLLTKPETSPDAKRAEKRILVEKPAPQLAAQRERPASVTDHTTRTFEPVYRERDTTR